MGNHLMRRKSGVNQWFISTFISYQSRSDESAGVGFCVGVGANDATGVIVGLCVNVGFCAALGIHVGVGVGCVNV